MRARAAELGTILRVYAGGKLPKLTLPWSAFGNRGITLEGMREAAGLPKEIEVEDGNTSCRGTIVGFAVIVELHPETEPDVHAEQVTLDA